MAFLMPQGKREPMFRVPAAVIWLIGALAVAHVARLLVPKAVSDDILVRFAFLPLRYVPGIDGGNILDLAAPFFGHQFLHANFFHLGMNAVWLLACGAPVARRYGTGLFVAFFLLCGVAGAAMFLACDWGGIDGMIGASGAVSGLMAASIRMITWQGAPWLNLGGARLPLLPLTSRPVIAFSLVWLATNLLFGLTGFGTGDGLRQIAWQAHVGGYAAGLLLPNLFDAAYRRLWPSEFRDPI
jgi:membrane associated rhomboid family serine protease